MRFGRTRSTGRKEAEAARAGQLELSDDSLDLVVGGMMNRQRNESDQTGYAVCVHCKKIFLSSRYAHDQALFAAEHENLCTGA